MKELQKITSRSNEKLKHARNVMRGAEPELIFVEGNRLVEEAVRSGIEIREVFVSSGFEREERRRTIVDELSCPVWEISESLADSISDTKNPQGIFAIAFRPKRTVSEILKDGTLPVVVYLHEINNPSNLGAILRTAEAAGVRGVIISQGSADPYSPKALRGAMGSAFRLPIVAGLSFEEVWDWAKASGSILTAADIEGETAYTDVDWKRSRLLVFGSEAHGLDDQTRRSIQDLIKIPTASNVESLNLAVSCGIVLFEAVRQNSK
jgi:RNA methyltransferase, TrmH family